MQHAYQQPLITLELAAALVAAVVAEASSRQMKVGIAVVDTVGQLKMFAKMDGASGIAIETSQRKAQTALMGMSSQQFGQTLAADLPLALSFAHLHDMTLLGGGLPIMVNDELIGAIGVGGGTVEEDIACAEAALQRVLQPRSE